MKKYVCTVCGYIYDEEKRGKKWEDLPEQFFCPLCSAHKSLFELPKEKVPQDKPKNEKDSSGEMIRELSAMEISAICSSLAKGCEKQRLSKEMQAFQKISDYFKAQGSGLKGKTLKDVSAMLENDLTKGFSSANNAAKTNMDRGALRSLVWSEKVSVIEKSLLDRFFAEGDAMLENTKIYVCDICGFIFMNNEAEGSALPDICPVCKVPKKKMLEVERR